MCVVCILNTVVILTDEDLELPFKIMRIRITTFKIIRIRIALFNNNFFFTIILYMKDFCDIWDPDPLKKSGSNNMLIRSRGLDKKQDNWSFVTQKCLIMFLKCFLMLFLYAFIAFLKCLLMLFWNAYLFFSAMLIIAFLKCLLMLFCNAY